MSTTMRFMRRRLREAQRADKLWQSSGEGLSLPAEVVMMVKRYFWNGLFALALTAMASTAAAQLEVGREFIRLDPPRPVATGGRIEVIEFFYYGCPICYETQPLLSRWLITAPEYVAIRRVPALSTENWESFAKLFYTLEALGEIGRLH